MLWPTRVLPLHTPLLVPVLVKPESRGMIFFWSSSRGPGLRDSFSLRSWARRTRFSLFRASSEGKSEGGSARHTAGPKYQYQCTQREQNCSWRVCHREAPYTIHLMESFVDLQKCRSKIYLTSLASHPNTFYILHKELRLHVSYLRAQHVWQVWVCFLGLGPCGRGRPRPGMVESWSRHVPFM